MRCSGAEVRRRREPAGDERRDGWDDRPARSTRAIVAVLTDRLVSRRPEAEREVDRFVDRAVVVRAVVERAVAERAVVERAVVERVEVRPVERERLRVDAPTDRPFEDTGRRSRVIPGLR